MRALKTIIAVFLFSWLVVGCAFNVGRQELRVRPGFRVPPRVVDTGDGEKIWWEGLDPDGNTMFIFIRGRF